MRKVWKLRFAIYHHWRDRVGVHVTFAAACAIYAVENDYAGQAQNEAINRGIVFG